MGSSFPATDCYSLINARLVTPPGQTCPSGVSVSSGLITRVFRTGDAALREGEAVFDVHGAIVAPGFIDMHVHGGGGADALDGTAEAFLTMARAHAAGGSTAIVPTIMTAPDDDLIASMRAFDDAVNAQDDLLGRQQRASSLSGARMSPGHRNKSQAGPGPGARLLGLHLEGPYFSPVQRGAQDKRFLRLPERSHFEKVLGASKRILRVSAAPELPGAFELGRELAGRGIVAAIGHSDATYDEVVTAVESGYSHVTHLYSAMSTVKRVNCFRVPGVLEAALALDQLTVEVIADGKHLPGSLLALTHKIKGPDRVALVSDALRPAGLGEGEYITGSARGSGQRVIVDQGVAWMPDREAFAGSVVLAADLVRNMVNLARVPLCDAITMASLTPARILGLDSRMGSLTPGKDANMVVLGEDLAVRMTIVEGRLCYMA
ncbi:MAG: N-acetylglucosamine-6-phosphate deacetylase [Firmicutes bacterium]|nr:N-acetylglucosamine-6-phosphate deacetylase [Bacillota bacterium]